MPVPSSRPPRKRATGRQTKPKPRQRARTGQLTLVKDRVRFSGIVDDDIAARFCRLSARALDDGVKGLTLDFGDVGFVRPESMMLIVAQVDHLRVSGMHFDVIRPSNKSLAAAFDRANWAYQLSPLMHDPSTAGGVHHLPVQRFKTDQERSEFVDRALEVTLKTAEISRDHLHALEWVLNELTDNVLLHAEASEGGFAHVNTFAKSTKRLQLIVADAGRGIPASMREGRGEEGLRVDATAIDEALKKGVTRSLDVGQGNGLTGAISVAKSGQGRFGVLSGRGRVFGDHRRNVWVQKPTNVRNAESLGGTVVYFEIRTDTKVDLEAALALEGIGTADWDYLDSAYGMDGGPLILKVKDEVPGTGSRSSGQMLRTKASNLLSADTTNSIVIDWDGLETVSSSFADETIGRLFAELGPVRFNSRVSNANMSPFVASLVDNAILQRIRQSG